MGLASVLIEFAIITGVMLGVATVLFVDLGSVRSVIVDRERARTLAPYAVALIIILLINRSARQAGPLLSWLIGWEITALIESIEGEFVVWVQSFESPMLTEYLAFMYLYGYAFLLIFPFVLYYVLPNTRAFRELAIAFGLNYTLGLLCYILFIAYGPRNQLADVVQPLLYQHHPLSQLVTREVNVNTNVFPSLHTSLSVTVALMAWRTRKEYPLWVPIAAIFAASVTVATVYTGIHWVIDVIAGIALAAFSVYAGARFADYRPDLRSSKWLPERLERTR